MQFSKFQYDPKEIYICKSATIIWPSKDFNYFYPMCELLHFISITDDTEAVKTVILKLTKRVAFKEWISNFDEPTFRKNLQESKNELAEADWMLKYKNVEEWDDLSSADIFNCNSSIPLPPPNEYEANNLMIIPLKRKRITFEDTDPSTTLDTHIEFEDTDPSTTLDTHIEFEDTDPSTTLDTHIEFEDTDPSTTLDTHIEFEDTDSTTLDTQKTKSSTTWVKEKTNEFELNIFQRTIDKKYHVSAKFMQILINRLLKQTSKELDDNAFALTHLDPEYNICIQGLEKTINATVELKYPDILDKISSIKDVLIRFQFDTVGHLITIQYKQSSALWDHEWEMSSVVLTDEYKRNLKDCDKNPVINPDVAQLLISQVISFMTRLRYTISENIEGYAESINQRILRTTAGDQLNIKLTQLLKTLNNIKVLHRFVFRKNTSYLNDRNMRDNIGQTASHTKRQIVYDTADSGGYNPKYLPKKTLTIELGFIHGILKQNMKH